MSAALLCTSCRSRPRSAKPFAGVADYLCDVCRNAPGYPTERTYRLIEKKLSGKPWRAEVGGAALTDYEEGE